MPYILFAYKNEKMQDDTCIFFRFIFLRKHELSETFSHLWEYEKHEIQKAYAYPSFCVLCSFLFK